MLRKLTLDTIFICRKSEGANPRFINFMRGGVGELILTQCQCHVRYFKKLDAILMICLVITYWFLGCDSLFQ